MLLPNIADVSGNPRDPIRSRLHEFLAERQGMLPVWIRAPKAGPEFYCGFSRSKLYELSSRGLIQSRSIRDPGQIKGTRLFNLRSILEFIENCNSDARK